MQPSIIDLLSKIAVFIRLNTVDQTLRLFGEYIFRISCPEHFYEKVLLFNKVSCWRPAALLKKEL